MHICTARPRRKSESYAKYHINLKKEGEEMKRKLSGKYIVITGRNNRHARLLDAKRGELARRHGLDSAMSLKEMIDMIRKNVRGR